MQPPRLIVSPERPVPLRPHGPILGVASAPAPALSAAIAPPTGPTPLVLAAIAVAAALLGAFALRAIRSRRNPPGNPPGGDGTNEQDLVRVIDMTPLPAALLTRTGRIVHLNARFLRTFGYSARELPSLEAWWSKAYPDPEYLEKVMRDWCSELESGRPDATLPPYETEVVCGDGTRRLIEWRATHVEPYALVVGTDFTERMQQSARLRENEERFRLLIENSTELVAQVDRTGRFVYASPNHLAITGYAPDELLGRCVFDYIHPDDAGPVMQAFHAPAEDAVRVFRYRFKDGTWHWLESAGRRFLTSSGIEMAAVISRDITARVEAEEARKRLETQLRVGQKMEAIGTLAGGIAHDFNNILTGLFGNIHLAQAQLEPDHPAQRYLANSYKASERARDLVAKILTFSRRHEQPKQVHRLGPIAREAFELLRASLPSTIEIRFFESTPDLRVVCDPGQVHQVIMNLGANAAHALRAKGGLLCIELDDAPLDPALAVAHPKLQHGGVARLTVRDTGSGMDAATRDRIFEPFFTTKPVGEGTGLGLAVVHGIIEDHGGAIAVESTPGGGTTFRAWFPLAREIANATDVPPPREPVRGNGERVLLVDDESAIVDVGSRIIRALGYEVTSFTRAMDALHALEAAPGEFALLISDLTMPELTGPDLAARARALRADLPVLITTGFLRTADVERARAAGVRHFLEKPFTLDSLAHAIRRTLERP